MHEKQTVDYTKFAEWLQLKRYSPSTIATTIRILEYFRQWTETEQIESLAEVNYQEAMGFIAWSSKHGASQKTIANYLVHIKKYYQFLITENEITENPVGFIKVQGIKRKIYYDILNVEELQHLYQQYPTTIVIEASIKNPPPQEINILSRKRNKVIVSLLIYQGLRVEEIAALTLQDLQLREGKIVIHSKRRTAARTMRLESHQVYELMDYVNTIRKEILALQQEPSPSGRSGDSLFVQRKGGDRFYNVTQTVLRHLRKINSRIKNLDQIRASVITAWLRQYDLRKVQYLAGHKYVGSTEEYKANVIDELQDDVTKYHPL
jgi:site-specific recombinase XerD